MMEYRQVVFNESTIDSLVCHSCDSKQHYVVATIKYAFMFLESQECFAINLDGRQSIFANTKM